MKRCAWATTPLGIAYHDAEWGVPVHDDRVLFEFIDAGRRAGRAQLGNDPEEARGLPQRVRRLRSARVARFTAARRAKLLGDAGIVRNRLKIESTVSNARAFLAVQREFGSFDAYLWGFVGGTPVIGRRRGMGDVPARTELSDALSKDLKRRGFRFVGSTICYAFMQAVGVVNDHSTDCFRTGGAPDAEPPSSAPIPITSAH